MRALFNISRETPRRRRHDEASFAEASLGADEASCSSKASVARTPSLGANEFLEVLAGALGATGVLARRRWQTSFHQTSFCKLLAGKLSSAQASTNVLPSFTYRP